MKSRRLLECEFAVQIEHLFDLYGWRWTHFRPALRQSGRWSTPLRGHAGFPDYVAVREGRLIFAEIKATAGRATPVQIVWLNQLSMTGAEVYLWHPEDLDTAASKLR